MSAAASYRQYLQDLEVKRDERDRVQKKTFTKWVNKHLIKVRKHITDLYEDLRDGHNLISLLEVLSGVTLPREKGRMRFHRLQNVQIALDFLKQRQVKLVNIRNDDITDGNPKLTLGLIWTIILHFQISEIYVSGESGDLTAKEKLLLWSQKAIEGYPGIRCVNFSSSWSDGRMFNALLHRYRPDLIDMELVARQSNRDNLEQAFEIAESLGVTRLLDAEDVDVPSPDEKSVITYVSSIYDAFPKIPEGGEGITPHEVDQRWAEYQSHFSSLLQWTRQHTALMASKNFPQNPVELKALYNEYVHFKETEIPAKETEKGHIEHLYKLLEVWIEFGRLKLPQGLHPNDLEEQWGKLILEMLEREKALRPAVERLELLLQMANKIQNMAVDCEEKLTLAKNTLQSDMSLLERGEQAHCEQELGAYLQDCEALVRQMQLDLQILRDEKYYQVEQLAFRVTRLQEELVSLRLQCSSVYRKGHFLSGGILGEQTQRLSSGSLATLGAQTLLGAAGVMANLLRRPMSRSELVAMSSSEDEGSLRFIYELLGWVEATQELLERAEWGSDLPSVDQHLQDHHTIHTAVEDQLHSLKEARSYEPSVSSNFRSNYSETLAKLENQYCKLLENSSWRLRCLESLRAFVSNCTEELIWLNEKEEEELAFDWSENNNNMAAKREQYAELRSELEEKQEVMHSLQETADQLCRENHPAKQTVEAYRAALQTQWQWVGQLGVCVEQHLKDNTAYFQFMSDARECETYLRQLQDTIKRQYTCDQNSRLGKLEDLLQDSMEEKEQLIKYRSSVASLVGRAKTVVQLRPRSAEYVLDSATPIRCICDYKQIEANSQITVSKGEECVLEDNSQRTKWKIISPTGNEAMVPSVCFTVPPPNQEAIDTASRTEQLYQNVMSLWHQLHMNMKSVVSWHYLQKDISNISSWTLDTMRFQSPSDRQQALDHLDAHLADFLADSRESALFTAAERRDLEQGAQNCHEHCQALLISMETVEKDESVSRSYLSELQSIKSHLQEAEQKLMMGMQTLPPSGVSGDGAGTAVQIAEQEKLHQHLKNLQSDLGDVSRRCVSFFEEKPSSSSVPMLRSELNLAVEKSERLNSLSSVYLHKLKTVDVLMRSLQAAESQVKKYEGRLSEEDIVPADTTAIQALREQIKKWHSEVKEQDHIFQSLSSEVQRAREAGTQLSQLHAERSPELERYQEKAQQLTERWNGIRRQMETRQADLEMVGSVLQQYRDSHSGLIRWIEETTAKQENTQPEQTDSKSLSEQLAQQTALVAEIEQNQAKLDECQTYSKHYCTAVKDYELQLMTFRAFVESTQKSPVKRRRMHSSSDAITQEFMDLRTRYTALVTLTTQHVKYISDALRRLEEEEKQVEEERQACVGQVSDLLGWVKGHQERAAGPAETSLAAQQAIGEQLASKSEEVAEAIRSTQVFLRSKQASKLSPEERAQVASQLDELKSTYNQLCDRSAAQLQQLEEQLAKEEKRKGYGTIAGVIDLGTVETFPVFQSAQRGLIDQDTCYVLLEAQLVRGGLLHPDSPQGLSLEKSFTSGLIDSRIYQSLSEIEAALHLVQESQFAKSHTIPAAAAMEVGYIKEQVGLRILELQVSTGGFWDDSNNEILTLENAKERSLISAAVYDKLCSRLERQELIDPNTAEKLSLSEFYQKCILNQETDLRLLPVNQQSRGTICLRSGIKVGIFRAAREGLIDREVTIRLLEAQLFAGGIPDPRTGHRLTIDEAVRHGLMDQDLACALLTHQLKSGGIIDPVTGERLELDEALQRNLLSPRMALRVLESLWAFMGLLWPESGELLPITEALQQGVISGDLARKVLNKRHFISTIYSPESGELIPLGHAEKVLGPEATNLLQQTHIPDFLPTMTQTRSLQYRGSFSSATASLPRFHSDTSFLELSRSQEQDLHYLLSYLMTHSYINAHSGERLVLLEPELMKLINVTGATKDQNRHKPQLKEPSDREAAGEPLFMRSLSETKQENIQILMDGDNTALMNAVQRGAGISLKETSTDGTLVKLLDTDSKVSETKPGTSPLFVKEVKMLSTDSTFQSSPDTEGKSRKEQPGKASKDTVEENQPDELARAKIEVSAVNKQILVETDTSRNGESADSSKINWTISVDNSEEAELDRMAKEMLQGGLLTAGSQKLLLHEAVYQDLLPGNTAVKLMSKAELFGGFLDAHACQPLSLDDITQKGLQDKELMTKVIQSEKTMAGVFDVEHGRICSLKEAAKEGLLDTDTVSRLLEAQIASGGIIDLEEGKKVSVNVAAKRGLIEEKQKDGLLLLEKSCHGKSSDSHATQTMLKLQLQMNGIIDPKTKQPVQLQQALQKGLITNEETEQILMQQVAEGGIVHHGSGIRLSVTDAVHQGIIDDSLASKLKQFEKSRRNQFSSDPDAAFLQATVGFIYDGASKSNLTLTEAVSSGVIDQATADKAMDSPNVKSGILDPQNACVLPYFDLIKQGKIDIETGRRFLEVRPFRGIPNKENGDLMTVPEAVRTGQVDPIPALRLLQSQADSGGIINISNGEKLPLLDAIDKNIVQKDVAMVIAKNQFLKGGIVSLVSGQRVSSLDEAVKDGLISKEMAAELCDNFGLVGPLASQHFAYQDSPTVRSYENVEVSTVQFANTKEPQSWTTDLHKDKMETDTDEKLQVHQHYLMSELVEQMHVDDSSGVGKDADVSLAVLSQFALKAERRLQEAIEECSPKQHNAVEPQQEPRLVQIPQISATEAEVGKSYDISPQTTKPFIQIQTGTKADINLENYEKTDISIVPEITQKVHKVQIDKETKQITMAPELQSVSDIIHESEGSTDNGNDILISTVTEEQKMPGKKKGRGKHKKQTKVCTESDKGSEVQLLYTSMTPQLQGTEDKNGIKVCSTEKSVPIVKTEKEVGMEFETRRTPVEHESSSEGATANEFRSEVLDIEENKVNTEEAKGSQLIKVSIVQKSEHCIKTSEMNATSPVHAVEKKTIEADLGIDQKSSEDKVLKQVTESEYRTEAVVTAEKSKEVDMKGEAQEDLQVLNPPYLSVTSPIEKIGTTSEKDAVITEKSEELFIKKEVKTDLEVIKASDLEEPSLVDNIEDTGEELVALDQRRVNDVKESSVEDIKVDLEVLKPSYMSMTSSIVSTENKFEKEVVVTDQKSEDLTMKRNVEVDLEVIKAADLAGVSLEEDIEGKSGTEVFVSDEKFVADVKEQKEDEVDVEILKPICMGATSPTEGKEPVVGKDIVATDKKSVEGKIMKEAKQDLKVITGVKYTKGTSGEDTGDQMYVEEQREIKMDLDTLKFPSIISPTEGTKNYDQVTVQKDLEVIKTPDTTEDSPEKPMESMFTKEFAGIDEKSIDVEVKIERLVKAETSRVPDTSDGIESIPESLHQEIEDVKGISVSKQRQPMENISLIAETSKLDPAVLVDVHTKDKLQRQMQSTVINDTSKTQVDREIDFNEDLAPDQSDKKRKKKRKNKKAKMENTEKESEESKADEPVQRPPADVASQSDTVSAVRQDEMEQPQKPKQAQREKEALLMKAKESILRKVFERGVSEKQAAEELEALRQGSAKERHEKAKLVEKSSSLHPKENETDVIEQTKQIDKNTNLLPENVSTGTDSTQTHFSHTDLTDDNIYKKQDLSCTESSHVTTDPSKQTSKPIIGIDSQVDETRTQESVRLKSEKLEDSVVLKEPKTTITEEDKDHQKSLPKTKDAVAQSTREQTSKTELEYTISKESLQAMTNEYSSIDNDFKDESSIEESSESRVSYLEEVPESDTTECWEEEDFEECQEGVNEKQAEDLAKKQKTASQISKSSLVRQECLEHDQQIVALLSMVRHTEVRLKQQQQQFMGRSLATLDDIIKQTEALALELTDLEPQVNREVEAAKQLLESHSEDVPPQLVTALEKDQRSLSRTFNAAKELAESALQGMQSHRDAQKEAVRTELESLTGRVDSLLSWLKDTETQMEQEGDSSEDGTIKENDRRTLVWLTQKLQQVKDLQECLTTRSNDVNAVAFDIQVFISECAQDLAPEQSRRLLRQLQQLQNAFHQASGRTHARAEALSVQRVREEEREQKEREREQVEREREKERQTAREREVVQQQKAECSQKLEGLSMWLAGVAGLLANQRTGDESDDVNVLQQKHSELKEVQKDLQTKGDGMLETIRSVEEFLAERGGDLSPEERAKLQAALTHMKEQYHTLTDTAQSSLAQLDSTINTTLQQNTQRAKAEEQLQETQGKIDVLLKELSTLDTSKRKSLSETVPDASVPVGSLNSHNDMLKADLQQLQAQQAHLLQVAQSTRSLLEQPDSSVPPEEKQRLRAKLDQLQNQHQERLQSCQERLRRTEALQDDLSKFMEEHGNLGAWLEQSERELHSLREGEADAQGLKDRLEEHKKLADDVICHKADLRFVSISGQKVLDSVQGSQEREGAIDPALQDTWQLVSDKLEDATQRYASLQNKSVDLGTHLSSLLDRYQQYQDEATALDSWLTAQEQNQSILKPSGEQTDTQTLQNTLKTVQHLQDELTERSVQLEKVRKAGKVLTSTQDSPKLKTADISTATDKLEKRFETLSECASQRAEQLQTAVAQSVSVQEGLKALLSWLDGLALDPGPVQPTAQAVQEALTQNQKLRQELLSRQGSVEATRDSVSKLLKSADASTVSGLQGALQDLNQRYTTAQTKQAEKEAELRAVLPKLEGFERLNSDLHDFTQSRERVLSLGGLPDHSVEDYKHTIEEVKSDLVQETSQLKSFVELGTDLSKSRLFENAHILVDSTKKVSDEFARLEASVSERLNATQGCDQQLVQFRSLSGSLLRWLQMAQEQLPAKEPNLNTEGLQRRVQQLKDLLSEWESQGNRVQELNKSSSELESLIISITAPQSKTSVPTLNGAGGSSSLNGIHTCRDLTEIQVVVADVNSKYEQLGGDLQERQSRQQASLELCQKVRQDSEALFQWLGPREQSLAQGQTASPSRPEAVHAQARENKALLSELTEHSGKVEDLKNTLKQLIQENPDSPEAETWKKQLQDLDTRWEKANQTAAQRQSELETCADRLGNFASAANQLGPWLREKELMMSVLGPLSIDPNMLNTQKQQVQFMLREFETRRAQFDQLTQAAEGILSPVGEQGSGDSQDVAEVKQELASITQQWEDLTSRLSGRSDQIERAQGTSERFQALLKELSQSLSQLAEKLDAQASLSAQPEALRHRLKETGEIRAELEQRRGQLAQAEQLCADLSAIVVEPYLREELHKRLESVSGPLNSLEERAADGLSQLQAALSSTQQFQQMFEELRTWLDGQAAARTPSMSDPLPCQPEALQALVADQEELQRGMAQQRGSYELIQAEGASILASLPAGDERSGLQARLTKLRQDWEEVNQCFTEKQAHIKETLGRAVQYKQHRDELTPWLKDCEQKEAEIQPSVEPAALEEALQKARQLGLDLDRRRPLLEALNSAADQLLEQSRTGEEEVRDEKAQLNRRLDGLSERLHGRMAQLEELNSRLKEFEDGRLAVERRLEAARHQLEVQEALGPQACSNKSLERLRSQQEALGSLQPQVVYLRDLAKGLAQDAPQTTGGSGDGGEKLVQQAQNTEREFGEVTEKIEQCCSSLESRLQGVGEVQSHVRDIFSRLADLDDELDSLSPVGRDVDSLASQADAIRVFLGRLASLRNELEGHGGACTAMLRREGSSPDLLALRREMEALNRQAAKLAERGQGRLALIEEAEERVKEFYSRLTELQGLLDRAEEGLNAQGVVGTEVDIIKQQLQEFKAVEREQIDSIQPKLHHVNAVGQGLIQSAAKHTDTQALEHDLETTNLQWNSLNKRVAERIAQLQEALLHCGKFQDALEPLLSWLSDTEELIANQKPPSAEYRVVKAQIQEQKLLQRLLDDRRGTVEMIRAEGERIAATAETQDREKIQRQLRCLGERWADLLEKANGRQRQLEELQVLALQFHESVEPLGEWLSATERRLSSAEPMGTQASKISQQISRHKALQEEVLSREKEVDHLEALGQSLSPLSCAADRDWLSERVGAVRSGHTELSNWCSRRAAMLEQALANAQLFGEEEVEVLNWLAEVAQRLAEVSVQSYQPELLAEQHKYTLSLNEEIVSRKKTVDQAIKNGQALLKQTTGEEVLLIQEKLDGIKSRYAEMTAGSSKALRNLEQALQLATRFASAHEDLNQWLDSVEAELNNMEPDTTPAYQERQKDLKCVSAEKRLILDTVNEVGSALLDLVPWRAREGLDRLVADANQRYRQADETITQRVQLVQAAIQRSQQYEEAVDAELAWVGETERKLASLGPLSLEPDVTVAQLQVQRAFNIDIIRHKDTVDQLLHTREDILESCSDQQREALKVKTDSLSNRYEAVSQNHAERFSALEQAQVLVARFWETYEELDPWLGETEALITQLPPPAIDTEALRQQQDQMRLLRESIAEHKPHIDKLLKIGPQLAELSAQEGATLRQRYSEAERRYLAIKEDVKGRAGALDEAFSQSAQFHDKMDPLLETLEGAVQRLRQPPPVAAEVEKIREQLAEHRAAGLELDKLLPSFSALCTRGEELITRAAHDDPAAQAVRSRLLRLRSLWDEIRQRAEEREGKLQDVLDLAGKFWADMAALLSTLRDSQEIVKELEDPGVDPSLIKQQIEAAEAIKAETDGLREELEIVRTLGADLIFACGETEKPEVKKTIDEMNAAWEGLNRTWRERMEKLEEAMTASVQYQDALQGMFDYLDNAVIKLCDMQTVGTDLSTVKQQIEELKQFKVEVYQQQIDMEKLCHQGELLLKKVSDQADRDMIQEPLTELRHLWDNLGDKITLRQHKLEGALLALGQFQHALSELQSWLSHTHATLDTQRPVSSDPKAIEIELAKHHVLRNDVLSHRATVETVNSAGSELLESSPGDEASHLRDQLDELNRSWDSLLLKTDERQKLLETALQQAEGFHGELEEFLQWLRRTESQLSAAKPTGGLPETAREQLQQHMELQAQLTQRGEQYHRLLDQGESMLLARGGEETSPGTTQTQQNLALLQNKWASLNAKMDDRRAKLEEAVSLATGFQSSLQDTINWLTQAEQTLNMAQPPSLILDTVLFQIDEHKVFVNEVNTHREQVLALEKAGSQLRFASLKQDVVLIKNLLLSVQARWDKLVQRSLDRGRHLDEARKRAKQFHEAWRKLTDWLEEAEKRLDSELEISNEPDKIKVQLTKHKEFQKALGSKQPVYDTTVRSGKAMRDKATLPADTQKLDNLLGEVRDKWDTVCGKSVERQHKLEEALLFSGQFAEALQALVDWLYRIEPQLAEDQPVHGDLDLVSNLMDSHKAFQKELGKRTSSIQALKRSARELMETGRDDTAWVKVQLQELSNRWETVCALSVSKQTRLQQALKQAEEFRTAVQMLLEWLSEAEQTLRFRGILPEEVETLQALLHTHRDFMQTVEEKRVDVNKAAGMGEAILAVCHPDCITTIKHWITIIRARFEEVLTWAKQHEQRLEAALTELLNNAALLEELLSWLQWAETTLVQRDTEPLPQDITQLKTLITEHQVFMEEMTRKQPDVDKVTKTYKRKPSETSSSLAERRGVRKQQQQQQPAMQVTGGNPRLNQLCSRWQQVWLLALDRQRKLHDALDRLEELKEFANFDFDVWRKKYMRWMNHKKSRVMDFFRRIDKDQDGKITRQEFIDGILASKFPTSKLEMTAVADIFDRDGDGYIDYYEFVAALHPNKDAYRPTTDADKIEDEVTRQVAQCKCAKRFQVEQIGENKYRFFLGNQFGDSQQLRLVRILRSTVMVRVGGGWMALDEFLVKNDPCRVQHPGLKILRSDSSCSISSRIVAVTPGYFCCRARGRTNLELREKFILPEGASQGMAAFRSRGRRSKPSSRTASPTRSSSSASQSAQSCASVPSAPATPTASSRSSQSQSRGYAKPWLAHSKTPTPTKCQSCPEHGHTPGHEGGSTTKLKRPPFHSSRGSLTGENGGTTSAAKPARSDNKRTPSSTSGPASRAGSRAGSRASSRRGSDASDASELMETRSACSDTSDTPRRPGSKPSKIPTISKKTPSPKTPTTKK
ncbi:microtubule-actin cross-linking factor 1 isoform X16 [Hemibagrus wyckioides]|uniref:microtubule-actin cross-linking factor 1 isoform X16 n=1 Tax=Hemibagrus wyckioides TaxID=337641 RepID=UPI00266B865C|nr:microtubule-actin cross-linking factor 1 isoform X16 [Hemibagrus wyckioides]